MIRCECGHELPDALDRCPWCHAWQREPVIHLTRNGRPIAPYDPAANSTEDMEPRPLRSEMIAWLRICRTEKAGLITTHDWPMIDAIIKELEK